MSTLAVQTSGLSKSFGRKEVVSGLDLRVPGGAVFGFLGPNGSGKTTTIRMLLGLIGPSAGTVSVLGETVTHARTDVLHRVGSLAEGPAFHPWLSGRANLARLDAADDRSDPATSSTRIDAALDRVGMLSAARKRFRIYSLGMRQRLAIAACLLQPRDLLILDEPTNGLDPQGTREVRHLVSSLAGEGATVLVSSHLLSEVEQVCTHLGIMSLGRLVAQGSMDDLRAELAPDVVLTTSDTGRGAEVLASAGLTDIVVSGNEVSGAGAVPIEEITVALVNGGVPVGGILRRKPTLEDLFVGLTGEGFDVHG